ncbi:RNA polymerase sigma factor [Spirosoma pollinicola]|uniref:RNA polymerase subunit sigma-24 n=1 Tax=Spirosoma pollinicola TaxID=2057025 RepID=A0A2K8Z329_9BACT|nr:RNA polymerase subunit sigma-24 [Spirosoma pollinicola]AUD04286.1 RNA polymerase subunit sigma-24 [Spirosoma pollinicola]
MSQPVDIRQDSDLPDEWNAQSRLDFSTLYDRYAPVLLGVITRIVTDKTEAVSLLEQTFIQVRSELVQFQSEKKPLFIWLLGIARCTALEAVGQRKQIQMPVLQLKSTGQVVALPTSAVTHQTGFCIDSTDANLKELLDSVLFKNCTPEEAAATIGVPVDTARQQLRLAIQKLR